jgi:threonine dehydrogenase-like Zn-dependent dehydrogenase
MKSRALCIEAARGLSVKDREAPEPAAGQVRVRLQGCGVCASNLPVWEGRPWFKYPMELGSPGHEGWGVIDALGENVRDFAVGERVAMLSTHAYAQHDIAATRELVRIPAEWGDEPFPGEPLACAMNILRRSQIRAGQTVAIVGIGFLGAVLTRLCVRAGANVVALSRRRFALETAEKFGASRLVSLAETRAVGQLSGVCERVIECVGSQQALDVASDLAATGGRLVIAGYHQDGDRRVDLQKWNWRGLDVVNAHERDPAAYCRGMQEALVLGLSGELDISAFFTHQFPLSEAATAFETLALRPDGFLKALLLCH